MVSYECTIIIEFVILGSLVVIPGITKLECNKIMTVIMTAFALVITFDR